MEDLGKIRIEYKKDNNVIRIYNSPFVCSLVINGKVVDQYMGAVAKPFILHGTIESDNETIYVAAKMGWFNMKLIYNGEVVAKKFLAFG